MKIEFVSSFAVITRDPSASRKLYLDTLGLPLEPVGGGGSDYYASEHVPGTKHFGVWPLAEAAQACFGTPDWPSTHPVPQASVEFDVPDEASVAAAAAELAGRRLHAPPRRPHRAVGPDRRPPPGRRRLGRGRLLRPRAALDE